MSNPNKSVVHTEVVLGCLSLSSGGLREGQILGVWKFAKEIGGVSAVD